MTEVICIHGSEITVHLRVVSYREAGSGMYVHSAPALDVSGYAYTALEAEQRFREALVIHFEEVLLQGTLEADMARLGWTKSPAAGLSGQVQYMAPAVPHAQQPAGLNGGRILAEDFISRTLMVVT